MLNELFEEISQEWKSSYKNRFHPFKYPTLATVGIDLSPRSRTLVIREVHEDLSMIIFTDARTQKVSDVENNPAACLHAYHPKQLKQLRWDGILKPINDLEEKKRLFQKVSQKALKDYTTSMAPGTPIDNPDHVEYVTRQEAHFLPLKFIPSSLEYLQLKRPNHLRAIFKKEDDWEGQWLTP